MVLNPVVVAHASTLSLRRIRFKWVDVLVDPARGGLEKLPAAMHASAVLIEIFRVRSALPIRVTILGVN